MKDTASAIQTGYIPGAIGRIAELHGRYYYENWNFGLFFEAKVATELSDFAQRYDSHQDGFWISAQDNRMEGAVIIDGIHAETEGAHLRWFILSDQARGKGIGRQLLQTAMDFCDQKGYSRTYLWTFKGLDAARHLYESVGFTLVKEQPGIQWGTEVIEQYFQRSRS